MNRCFNKLSPPKIVTLFNIQHIYIIYVQGSRIFADHIARQAVIEGFENKHPNYMVEETRKIEKILQELKSLVLST